MTLKIEVTAPFEVVNEGRAGDYVQSALSAIGFFRSTTALSHAPAVHNVGEHNGDEDIQAQAGLGIIADTNSPKRERGKPSAGRARRTKEEIAEDEAADSADAATSSAATEAGLQAGSADDSKLAIQTVENRTGPEDSPEDQAQDAADEAAETEAKRDPAKPLTRDDVKGVLGQYVKTYGMAAAQEDGPKVIALMFGEGKVKISDIPEDQESLAKAIAGFKEMFDKNPYGRQADL